MEYEVYSSVDRMAFGKRSVESVIRDMATDTALVRHVEQTDARKIVVDHSLYVNLEPAASTD